MLETLIEMNAEKPLVFDSRSFELGNEVEEHIADFPGSVLHTKWDQTLS